MKKTSAGIILSAGIIIIIVICFGIGSANDVELQLRTYRHGELNTMNSAYITMKEDNVFQFNYSLFSSYIAIGKYTVQGKELFCKTDDGKFEYVFTVDDNTLVFNKKKSSRLPEFSNVEDGAVFE